MDTQVFVCTHKLFHQPEESMYHPLQVGHALHEDLGYETDDVGENISKKNDTFCELTGLYWIWKNVACDIVGISHYRRYFFQGDHLITKPEVEELLRDHDVILSGVQLNNGKSVLEDYAFHHNREDILLVREILNEKYPD